MKTARQQRINRKRPFHRTALAPRPIASCVLAALAQCAAANPTGHQVAAGSASVQASGKTLTITNTPGAILNWQSFSIAPGELTRFVQQSSASAVLNRVVAANPSSIMGTLASNGRVFLVNPHGIVIGAGALIDTAGFVASTLNIADRDFLAGKMKFEGGGAGVLRNEGTIQAARDIFLVGPKIENTGIIHSANGDVVLAAGKSITITSPDAHGVQFGIQAPEDSVINLGSIRAANAVGLFAGTLRHSGEISATSASLDSGGRVVLGAQGDITIDAGSTINANGTSGGRITIVSREKTLVSGSVEASGSAGSGGLIQVLGKLVGFLTGGRANASGDTGGGTILVGGDYKGGNPGVPNAWRTYVGAGAALRADAVTSGNGGKVIVWADDITRFNGTISARGGARSGDGGFIETSGRETLLVGPSARVDTKAPAGRTGKWLLDPKNILVQTGGGALIGDVDMFATNAGGDATIDPGTIVTALTTADVTLQANNNITIANDINSTSSRTLTAQAGASIFVNANITTDDGDVLLIANETVANGVNALHRVAGPAMLSIGVGKTINTVGANIELRMHSGAGHDGTSGNIVVGNLIGNNVTIIHQGTTADSKILLNDAGSSLNVNNGDVIMRLESAAGANASIGTLLQPIRIAGGGFTPTLQAHTANATGGIFVHALGNLQINSPLGIDVPGVQNLAGGPISIRSDLTLTQTGGTAVCGAGGAGTFGGPICAGSSAGSASALGATDTVTLRASDMDLAAPIRGKEVTLLPLAGGTISPGSAGGAGPSLFLTQTEIDWVDTGSSSLHIGEDASGNIAFGGNITTPPGDAAIEFRTGGTITSSGGTDITSNSATGHITLTGASIGATGAGRLRVNPGTANVTATSTTGGIFLQQSTGTLTTNQYTFTSAANQAIELATTNAGMTVNSNITAAGSALSLITTTSAPGPALDITFTGTRTLNTASVTLTGAGGGAARFNAGNTTAFTGAVTSTNMPVNIGGGTANFNGTTDSTLTGVLTVSSGTLGGTGAGVVNANGGLTWTGGQISKTSGAVTVPGTTTINSGSPQLTGNLSLETLNYTGGTFSIGTNGVLQLTGAANSTLNNVALSISGDGGRLRLVGTGNLSLTDATVANDGMISIESANVGIIGGGTSVLDNNANATIAKTVAGTSTIGNPLTFNNAGTLDAQAGILSYTSTNNFNDGTTFMGAGTHSISTGAVLSGTSNVNASSNLQFAGGNLTGGGTLNVSGSFSVPAGPAHDINGPTVSVSGTTHIMNGATLRLITGGFNLNGNSTIDGTITAANGTTVNFTGGTAALSSTADLSGAGAYGVGAMGTLNLTDANLTYTGTLTNAGNVTSTNGATVNYAGSVSNSGTFRIQGGNTVQVNGALFDQAGGTLDLASGTLTKNNGTFNWSDGTISGTGVVNLSGTATATLTGTGTRILAAGTNVPRLDLDAPALQGGSLTLLGGIINTTGTFTNNGTVTVDGGRFAPNRLDNANTFTFTSGNFNPVTTANNTGTFNVSAGSSLDLARDGTHTGTFSVGAGGTLFFNGNSTHTLSSMAHLTGAGNYSIGGGGGGGGTLTSTSADFASTGTFNVAAGSTLNVNAGGVNLAGGGTHSGTFTVANSAGAALNFTGGTQSFTGSVFNATGVGAIAFTGGTHTFTGNTQFNGSSGGIISNSGTSMMQITGGTVTANTRFDNRATFTLTNGTVSLTGGGIHTNGTFDVAAMQTLDFAGSQHTLSNTALNGAGTYQLSAGSLHVAMGTTSTRTGGPIGMSGTTTIDGAGTLNLANTANFDFSGTNIKTLSAATITNAGATSIADGTLKIIGGGTLNTAGTTTISQPATLMVNNGTFTPTGAVTVAGGLRVDGGTVNLPVGASHTGTFDVSSNTATINFAGGTHSFSNLAHLTGPGIYGIVGSSTRFDWNGGTYDATGTFNNGGILNVNAGTMSFPSSGLHTGTFNVDTGSTLIFGGGQHTLSNATLNGPGTYRLSNGSLHATMGTISTRTGGVLDWIGSAAINGAGRLVLTDTASLQLSGVGTSKTLGPTRLDNAGPTNILEGTLRIISGGALNTAGAVTISQPATLTVNNGTFSPTGAVTVDGILRVDGGIVSLPVGAAHTGTFDVSSNTATINFAGGTHTFSNLSRLTGPGIYGIVGSSTRFDWNGGTYDATGTFNNGGVLDLNAGTLSFPSSGLHTGTFNVPAGGPMLVFSGGTHTLSNAALNGGGTYKLTAGTLHAAMGTISTSTSNVFDWGGTATINGAGTLNLASRLDLTGTGVKTLNGATIASSGQTRVLDGTLRVVGGGALNPSGFTTILGLLTVNNGTFGPTGGISVQGTLRVDSGTVNLPVGGVHTGTFDATSNSAMIDFMGGTHTLNGTRFTGPGTIVQSGASILRVTTNNVTADVNLFSLTGGQFNVDAGRTFSKNGGTFAWSGGQIGGGGTLTGTGATVTFPGNGARFFNGPTANLGTFDLTGGSITMQAGTVNVAGDTTVRGGTNLTLLGTSTLRTTGRFDVLGTLNNSAVITNNTAVEIGMGGIVSGTGTFNGNVINTAGSLTPGASPGTMVINGNYTQSSNGTLVIDIEGTQRGVAGGYDFLDINGTATLAGTLLVRLGGGFTPAPSDVFNFMRYQSRSGDFTNFQSVPPGFAFATQAGPTGYGAVPGSASSSGGSSSSDETMSTNTATNDVVALKEEEKTSSEVAEQTTEDDKKKEKGAVCS